MRYSRKVDPKNPYATLEWGVMEQNVTIAGRTRRCLTYIPDGVRSIAACVIILGPDGCSAEELLENSGWRELADSGQEKDGLILFFAEPEKADGITESRMVPR